MSERGRGKILTFYSYKGGTGRSMALANVAWILASAGKRVLAVDWDLEAPGLHRYFRPFLVDERLVASEGVIDLVLKYATAAASRGDSPRDEAWVAEQAALTRYTISLEWEFPHGTLDLIPAGRQDVTYATRVSTFNWQNFYDHLGGGIFINALRDLMRAEYDYVLIDSRTGVSDTSGICTVQLPDDLVVCLTYNNQSTEGAVGVARSVLQQRAADGDTRLNIFPLPMRVESFESDRLATRQKYARNLFDPLLGHIAGELAVYWRTVEIPYVPRFAYEETLATFRDEPFDPKGVLHPLINATRHLTRGNVTDFRLLADPKSRNEILEAFAKTGVESEAQPHAAAAAISETAAESLVRRAERAFARLSDADREQAKWLWMLFLRLPALDDRSQINCVRVPATDLAAFEGSLGSFVVEGVIVRSEQEGRYEVADATLPNTWPRLREWVDAHRGFLIWRERLQSQMLEWESSGRHRSLLLQGVALKNALAIGKRDRVTAREREYVEASRKTQRRRTFASAFAVIIVVASIVAIAFLTRYQRDRDAKLQRAQRILAAATASDDPGEAALLLAELSGLPQPASWVPLVRDIAAQPIPQVVLRAGDTVNSISFANDSKVLAIATADTVMIADPTNGRISRQRKFADLGASTTQLKDVFFGKSAIVLHAMNGSGRYWPIDSTEPAFVFDEVAVAAYASAVDEVFLIGPNGIDVTDSGGRSVRKIQLGPPTGIFGLAAVTPDGKTLALATPATIMLEGSSVGERGRMILFSDAIAISLVRANRIAAASSTSIRVEDVKTGRPLFTTGRPESITSVGLSPDGKLIAWGADDGSVRLTDSETVVQLRGHKGRITCVAFSPDGKLVATASADGSVRIWRATVMTQAEPMSWEQVPARMRRVTTACLTEIQRTQLLGEEASVASARARECESGFGRVKAAAVN